jgi:hypothetical protein
MSAVDIVAPVSHMPGVCHREAGGASRVRVAMSQGGVAALFDVRMPRLPAPPVAVAGVNETHRSHRHQPNDAYQ